MLLIKYRCQICRKVDKYYQTQYNHDEIKIINCTKHDHAISCPVF